MSQPMVITLERVAPGRFKASVEEAGTRYALLGEHAASSASTATQALAGLGEMIDHLETEVQRREAKEVDDGS